MKRVVWCASALMWLSVSVCAQGPAQQGLVNLSQYLQGAYASINTNLTQVVADTLPEADSSFKPSSMPEMRTFGQLFGHVANAQLGQCAAARGVPNPNMGTNNEQKTTRAEILEALADSFVFCDEAFASLTEENGTQMLARGRGQFSRSAILTGCL